MNKYVFVLGVGIIIMVVWININNSITKNRSKLEDYHGGFESSLEICNKNKEEIVHQLKNLENLNNRFYVSALFDNGKCYDTKSCQELVEKQKDFFGKKYMKAKSIENTCKDKGLF